MTTEYWQSHYELLVDWLNSDLLVMATMLQLAAIGMLYLVALWLKPHLQHALPSTRSEKPGSTKLYNLVQFGKEYSHIIVWVSLLWVAVLIVESVGWPGRVLIIAASLILAWIVIRLGTSIVRNEFWRGLIVAVSWTIAALNILGFLGDAISVLDNLAINLGTIRLSAYGVVKAIIALGLMLWLAMVFSNVFDRQIRTSKNFSPSVQVLLSKLVKVVFITLAILIALSGSGIDLTAFALFSGAVGVGLGFGLQKIVSNLISGVILLLDKSIKPGDVIAVSNNYGRVDSLGARYVSVITRGGIEHLIPNEELIVTRVENWSYSNDLLRLKAQVGVHYKSDLHKAMELCIEATKETDRVLEEPKPVCLLRGFGDSSVDLEVRFWINDPMNGRANLISEILLKIWDKFHRHNIQIPYPQRDLHLRTSSFHSPMLEDKT
ncbi:mechanosensitive ion channel family protein [Pseudomonadota bacterium]